MDNFSQKSFEKILGRSLADPRLNKRLNKLLTGYMGEQMNPPVQSSALDLSNFRVDPYLGRMDLGGIVNPANPPSEEPTISVGNLPEISVTASREPVRSSFFGRRENEPLTPAEELAQREGIDLNTYRKYRNLTAFHESADSMDPTIRQKSNKSSSGFGPGRGLFQFEPASAKTAAKSLRKYFKKNNLDEPPFIAGFIDSDLPDATTLSPRDQEILLFGQMLKGNGKLYSYFTDKEYKTDEDFAELWFKNHNRSKPEVKEDRINSFLKSSKRLGENVLDINTFDRSDIEVNRAQELQFQEQMSQDMNQQLSKFVGGNLNVPVDNTRVDPNTPDKLFLGKVIRGIGKGIGAVGKGLFNTVKGVGDFALSSLGMPNVINNSAVDNSGFLSGFSGMLSKIAPTALNVVLPGAGSALSGVSGLINNATFGEKDLGRKQGPGIFNTLGTLGQIGGMALGSLGGGLADKLGGFGEKLAGNSSFLNSLGQLGSNQGLMSGIGGLSSMIGAGNMGGQMMTLPPGYSGMTMQRQPMSNYGMNMFGRFSSPVSFFQNGGIVDVTPEGLVPVQTEKYKGNSERVIFPDGIIAKVNAKKSHEKMSDDHVTDVIPEGSYVASARKEASILVDDLKEFKIGYVSLPYSEHRKGKVPELITAGDIVEGKKKILPTEYAKLVQNKFKVEDKDDIFARATNVENLNSRRPYLEALVILGERNREMLEGDDSPEEFKYGGRVKKMELGDIAGVVGSALPFLGSLFGGTRQGVDRQAELLSTGALPLSSLGITNNINAQQGALDNALVNLQGLTGDLQGLNNMGTMAGIGGQLMQQTDLPELNYDFSRLQNFNTTTPQSLIDAAATPTIDATTVLDRLGDRGGATFLANSMSQQMNSRNQAAGDAFARQQQMDLNIANQLTQGMNQEEAANNQIRQQEINARNNVFNNIAGQVQGNLQNRGNILSNAFTTGTELDMQRSQLAGQIPMQIAQQMMNAAAMRTAQQGAATPGGERQGGLLDMLGGLFSGNNQSIPNQQGAVFSSDEARAIANSALPQLTNPLATQLNLPAGVGMDPATRASILGF